MKEAVGAHRDLILSLSLFSLSLIVAAICYYSTAASGLIKLRSFTLPRQNPDAQGDF